MGANRTLKKQRNQLKLKLTSSRIIASEFVLTFINNLQILVKVTDYVTQTGLKGDNLGQLDLPAIHHIIDYVYPITISY